MNTSDAGVSSACLLTTRALIGVLLMLGDIVVSIVLPGGEVEPGARSATEWFALFRDHAYLGFRELGFLNVLNLVLGIPLLLALYAAHRRVDGAYAVLVRGADFTPGSLAGFVLPSLGQIAMSVVMLRGGVFGRATAYAGIAGFSLLLVFTVWMTFAPGALETAMLIALPAGLLVMAWNVLVARKPFGLAGGRGKERHAYEGD